MFSARGVRASLQGLYPHERGVIDPFWVLRGVWGRWGDNQVSECKSNYGQQPEHSQSGEEKSEGSYQ